MAERPNGLASLADARQRARRTMPPPRHPASRDETVLSASTPAEATAGEERPASASGVPAQRPLAVAEAVAREPVRPLAAQAVAPKVSDTAVEPPIKLTLYLDQDIDRYLEDVRIQGLTARPRVDVSRSAVVRLALRRLRAEMDPDQVKALLAAQPTDNSRTGRKRR